jgi:hypothetical protein
MKRLLILALLLALARPAEAFPWKKVLVAGAAAGIHAAGLHHCRMGNVERCDGHYGSAWGIWGAATALNFVMIPVSEKIGGKMGATISYSGSAWQAGHGIYEWRQQHAANVDLRGVVLVRH